MTRRLSIIALVAASIMVACHNIPTEPAQVGSVSLDPSVGTVPMGSTVRLVATVRDAGGSVLSDRVVTFQSSDPQTALVDNSGTVLGVTVGLVTITASSGEHMGSATVQVSPPVSAALALNTHSACALTETGAAFCWGANDVGQLGNNSTAPSTVPVPVAGGLVFTGITASYDAVCGVVVNGAAYCWGGNLNGQLGNGSRAQSLVPVPVSGGLRFQQVTAGAGFACGLTLEQVAYCWGINFGGELGNGTLTTSAVPLPVLAGPVTFRVLSAGLLHACGLTRTGAAYCWGGNTYSQLGDGTSISRSSPVPVGGGLQFTSLHAGATTTCGIASGEAYCWGSDFFGSLGQGTTAARPDAKLPGRMAGVVSLIEVHAAPGNSVFTPGCGIVAGGAAYCWGANSSGQLGTNATPDTCAAFMLTFGCSGTPLAVVGGQAFQVVIPGAEFVCGITVGHAVYCWGANSMGELGNGAMENSNVPVAVLGGLRSP